MPYSVSLDLEDGGTVTYDNVISCTIEDSSSDEENEIDDSDMAEPINPMDEEEDTKPE